MIWALLLTPAIAGLLAFVVRPNWPRRMLLVLAAAAHSALVCAAWTDAAIAPTGRRLRLDGHRRRSLLFLTITSVLFLAAADLCRRLSGPRKPGRQRARRRRGTCRSRTFPRPSSPAACCCFWRP